MIKTFFQKYKIDIILSLFLALITGFIFYYPNYKVEKNISRNEIISKNFIYSPVTFYASGAAGDELHYAAICRKIQDGISDVNDVHIFERRSDTSALNKLPYIIAGIISKHSGSVISFFKWKNFLFPFLSVIIGYFFLLLFFEKRVIAFWGIILLLFRLGFIPLINVLLFRFNTVFIDFSSSITTVSEKYPSYQLVFPYTFLFYIFCYLLLKKNNNKYCIATGIIAGISFYLYFYSFISVGLQLIFLMIWTYFQKKKKLSLRFLISGVISLLIGSFYIKNVLVFMLSPDSIFKSMAIGFCFAGESDITTKDVIEFLCLSAFVIFLSWKVRSIGERVVFTFSIGIPALLITLLSKFILLIPETQHFRTFELRNTLLLLLLFIILILMQKEYIAKLVDTISFNLLRKKQEILSFIRIALVVAIVFHSFQVLSAGYYFQKKKSAQYYHRFIIDRDIMEAYNWLNKQVSKDKIVLSIDPEQINLIPIFTGLYTYLPDLIIGMSPITEIFSRIKEGFGFYGIKKEVLVEILNYETPYGLMLELKPEDNLETIRRYHYEYKKRCFTTLVFAGTFAFSKDSLNFRYFKEYFTPEETNLIYKSKESKRFVPAIFLKEQLKDYKANFGDADLLSYKVDYVWFGPYEKKLSGLNQLKSKNLSLVFQNKAVNLYKVF